MSEHGSQEHKRFSPSQADRNALCPGSAKLLATVPVREDTGYSDEGNIAHHILDVSLSNGVRTAVEGWAEHSDLFYLDPDKETCEAVQEALDYVYEILDDNPGAILYVETFVDPPVHSAPGEAGGYCDIAIWIPSTGHLYVIDYKHGVGVYVAIEGNRQVTQYAAGFVFGGTISLQEIQKITIAIVQPRSFNTIAAEREADITVADLLDYLIDLDESIAECLTEAPLLVPGETQCQFCDAVTSCPAVETQSLAVVGAESVKELSNTGLVPPKDMPVDRLAYVMQAAPVLKKWLKECEAHATELARGGYTIPSRKLVEAQATRKWYGKPEDVAAQFMALTNCELDDIFPRKLLGVTDAEKIAVAAYKRDKKTRKAKKKAAEDAKQAMAFLTLKTSSGNTSLVPTTDSRPAVNIAAHFNNVSLPTSET